MHRKNQAGTPGFFVLYGIQRFAAIQENGQDLLVPAARRGHDGEGHALFGHYEAAAAAGP
jgi:hypothetical protein